jgi:hypothetical protein
LAMGTSHITNIYYCLIMQEIKLDQASDWF